MAQQFASDYIDVAARLVEFRTKYPDGSLQPVNPAQPFTVMEIGGKQRIVVVAAAYRHEDDKRPGIGMAYEEVPGRTPYTRDSELQNAETSAWGRAIVAALAADTKKGIASAEEVRNRQAERDEPQRKAADRPRRAERSRTTPDDDPFYAPPGEVPPTPPKAEGVTDVPWFEAWQQTVDGCTDLAQLAGLWNDAIKARRERRISEADFADALVLKDVTKAALERAQEKADGDWPSVAPVPGSESAA